MDQHRKVLGTDPLIRSLVLKGNQGNLLRRPLANQAPWRSAHRVTHSSSSFRFVLWRQAVLPRKPYPHSHLKGPEEPLHPGRAQRFVTQESKREEFDAQEGSFSDPSARGFLYTADEMREGQPGLPRGRGRPLRNDPFQAGQRGKPPGITSPTSSSPSGRRRSPAASGKGRCNHPEAGSCRQRRS